MRGSITSYLPVPPVDTGSILVLYHFLWIKIIRL